MKIVIDLPRVQYSLIMQSHRAGVVRYIDKESMIYAIKNGTPLEVLDKIRADIAFDTIKAVLKGAKNDT